MRFPPRPDLRNISEMVKVAKNIRLRENRCHPFPHMHTASVNFIMPPLKQDFMELAKKVSIFPLFLNFMPSFPIYELKYHICPCRYKKY